MTAGRVPEDSTSGLTGGPQPPAGASDGAEQQAPDAPVARAPRLQALAGLSVRDVEGRTVGRVRDIYQQDAGGALAAITVMPRQLSSRTVLLPASAIETLPPLGAASEAAHRDRDEKGSSDEDPVVRLRVDAATARAGKRPPETAHVTPQDLQEAAAALGLDHAEGPDRTDSGGRDSAEPGGLDAAATPNPVEPR